MKFQLLHNGEVIAEANWSTVLFTYIKSRPTNKQGNYNVKRNPSWVEPSAGVSLAIVEDVEGGHEVLTPAQKAAQTRKRNAAKKQRIAVSA